MFDVMMRCPVIGQESPLGMEVPSKERWETIKFENSIYPCGVCGQDHLVDKQNARLQPKGEGFFRRN